MGARRQVQSEQVVARLELELESALESAPGLSGEAGFLTLVWLWAGRVVSIDGPFPAPAIGVEGRVVLPVLWVLMEVPLEVRALT